ncbi:MAG TPA: ArsA family ATPase [Actinomycetota bacterium]|nr:ArsA family ATPase [Actinomycetota bacterium]
MLLDEFLAPRILIVSGKGGVGKTTVAGALALVAARRGRRVCVAEVDRKGSLGRLLGRDEPLGYEPAKLTPSIWGLNIVPEDALAEYLDVQYHMKRVARIFKTTNFVDYVAAAAPGLKDILVLGKIWFLEQERGAGKPMGFDTIVVDAPAAGHMLSFLSAPMGLSDAIRVGPIRRQSDWLVQMLRDPERCRVHLVTLAEEMPVAETLETSEALADRVQIDMGPIFANAVYEEVLTPDEEDRFEKTATKAGLARLTKVAESEGFDEEDVTALVGYMRFLQDRRAIQSKHLSRLRKGVEKPVVELPFLYSPTLGLPDVEALADAIEEQVEKL